ncbi:S-methyl-5'-thioinosine phosphorylase [Crenobacter caeni]|uniref:Probable S-methyl-5'-thioinosine phosphorylase n=1 Tax=Crenobacter caeni TaxID=2705474 RepID=A0A6B2KP63_9NEIS|nr:S-methyl-5'-thioinosine phosphorylase [Crenobacter caeni]NDV11958.1 S-methyl-5'-thioinosine phosphorylase [Crenobacter caeni]
MLAIIGGRGLNHLPNLEVTHRQVIRTPYGDPSCPLTYGRIGGTGVVFMARHGYGHSFAPHEINYRANLWALHSQGVQGVLAVGAVGCIRADLAPGTLVLPDDIIDYTWGRKHTYFDGPDQPVVHADFTRPYCPQLRARLLAAAEALGVPLATGATYGVTQGPRLETRAEIARLERDGCDVVGMTGMPEAALARELKLPYAHLCLVVNDAAGKGASQESVAFDLVRLSAGMDTVGQLIEAVCRGPSAAPCPTA